MNPRPSNKLTVDYKKLTFSLQLLSMDIIERQTDCTERAGDQSSVKMDKQICPLLYTCG